MRRSAVSYPEQFCTTALRPVLTRKPSRPGGVVGMQAGRAVAPLVPRTEQGVPPAPGMYGSGEAL